MANDSSTHMTMAAGSSKTLVLIYENTCG